MKRGFGAIAARTLLPFSLAIGLGVFLVPGGCRPQLRTEPVASINGRTGSEPISWIGRSPLSRDAGYTNLQFINSVDGWFAADSHLWKTENGGRDWELIYSTSAPGQVIFQFQMLTADTGWVIDEDDVLRTDDGGKTWIRLHKPLPDGRVSAFHFLEDGRRGWWAGVTEHPKPITHPAKFSGPYRSNGSPTSEYEFVSYTGDGGANWKLLPFPLPNGVDIWHWSDAEHIWAIGLDISYWRAGRWKTVNYSDAKCENRLFFGNLEQDHAWPYGPETAFFLNDQEGWISYTNGYVAKTSDGGRSWCDQLDPGTLWPQEGLSTYFKRMYFSDSLNGWGLDEGGTIFRTNDGGKTWAKVKAETSFDDIYFLDANHGWAISDGGFFRVNP